MIATLTVRPGQEGRFRQVMAANVAASRRELGVVAYQSYRTRDHARVFLNYELYTDAAAYAAHRRTPWVRRTLAVFRTVLAEPPEVRTVDRLLP